MVTRTCRPAMRSLPTAVGSSDRTAKSASLPGSIVPLRCPALNGAPEAVASVVTRPPSTCRGDVADAKVGEDQAVHHAHVAGGVLEPDPPAGRYIAGGLARPDGRGR